MNFCCRSCSSTHGHLVLDLGTQPLANNLLRAEDLIRDEPRFPLRLAVCESCWLMQIMDLVPPVQLFSEYLYFSSFSEAMVSHAEKAARRYIRDFDLGESHHVVEIASNDGYCLKNFVAAGIPCLGIEPAANIARVAQDKGIPTLTEFFSSALAIRLREEGKMADLILGNNVFAHAPEINDFVCGLKTMLKADGRIILEFPYGMDLLKQGEFDTIYHEHVFYLTLTPLEKLFARHDLEMIDVERLNIHGGSLRLEIAHTGAMARKPLVDELINAERLYGLDSLKGYQAFAQGPLTIKHEISRLLSELKSQGKSLAAYGASAKGSTLLNFCQIGKELLEFVADRSTYKQGRFTPGTHLPIVCPSALNQFRPDYTLLLTWNFAEEILNQQRAYRESGGKFILPIPQVRIV